MTIGSSESEHWDLKDQVVDQEQMAEMRGMSIDAIDCVFRNGDLSLTTLAFVRGCRFENVKLRGTIVEKHLSKTTFHNSQLIECRLRMIEIREVAFEESQLLDCDFYGSNLKQVAFPNSTFEGLGFDACELVDVDLADVKTLHVGDPTTLRNATIDASHVHSIAEQLAERSGIKIQR